MFLSKIWFVLVGLLAGVAMTAAFVAPRPADRRIEQLEGQRLDRAQYAAEQMLKTDAHRWIDYVAKLGRDVVIAEALDAATRATGEPKMIHETVRARLHTLIPDLAIIGVESLIAVDDRGRVVARVGPGEREADYGEAITGAEVVADALRGYQSDDVWGAGGKLRRIAAAPVLSKGRDRIVGAMIVGAETGKRLAELWKKNLGVDIAVLLRKQILTSTLPEAVLGELPDLIDARKGEIAESRRSRAISLPVGGERMLAVAAPFTGQAAEQDAYYVLIGKTAPASNPWALLSSTAADDLRWGHFPWLGLGGMVIAILAIGILLQHYETEQPLDRLRRELRKVAAGDLQKIDDHRFPGKFGGVARDVNAAVERFTHGPGARADGARSELQRKDIGAILDSDLPEGPTFDVPAGGPLYPAPLQAAGAPFLDKPLPAAAPSPFGSPFTAAPPSPFMASPPAAAPPPRLPQLVPATAGGGGSRIPMPPPSATVAMGGPVSLPPLGRPPVASVDSSQTIVDHAVPSSLFGRGSENGHERGHPEPLSAGPEAFGAEMTGEASTSPAGADDRRSLDVPSDEVHVREVFAEYLAARRQCGESTANLTLEKFRAKLDANRQQLIAKYGCRTARFSVYIKDGKAGIKATPLRD
jgi:hypothetical protein